MKKILKFIVQYYLKILTKVVLFRHKPEIIAIAGTTNKTLIKEMVRDILRKKFEVRANPKSYNTEIGLPLAVFYLPSGYSNFFIWLKTLFKGTIIALFSRKFPKKLVLELGVSQPKDMDYLLTLVKPKIVILTEITPLYQESFGDLDLMAKEFAKLIKTLSKDGYAILNYDDERVRNLSQHNEKIKYFYYGLDEKADIFANEIETNDQQSFYLNYKGKKEKIVLEKRGRHYLYAFLASSAIKTIYNLDK